MIKIGVIQFVFIKPITALTSILLFSYNLYDEESFDIRNSHLYISMINNVCITIAMYCLALFYIGLEKDLLPFRPLSKFICIKFVLFFSFWQTLAFQICMHLKIIKNTNAHIYQSFLMCFEMMLAAIAHNFAFSHNDFVDYSKNSTEFYNNFKTVINVSDLLSDAESVFTRDLEDKPLCEIDNQEEKHQCS